jgi:hypothetical protein
MNVLILIGVNKTLEADSRKIYHQLEGPLLLVLDSSNAVGAYL